VKAALLLTLFLSTSAMAKKYQVSTWWRLGGENTREADLNTRGDNTSFLLTFQINRNIGDWAEIRIAPGFKYSTGNGQGLIHDTRPKNSLFASEAIFKTNHEYLQVTAGAISQRHVHLKSVVSHLASFPAAMTELFIYQDDDSALSARGQVAIPAAYTFSSDSTESETSPRLYTASLEYKGSLGILDKFRLTSSYFSYQDLPQVLAVNSADQGNTVDLTSSTTGKFRYDFRGFGLSSDVSIKVLGGLSLISSLEFAKNQEADPERNQSLTSWTGFKYQLANSDSIKLKGLYMRRESDVGPAALNYGLAFNNRVGHGFKATYSLAGEKMKFSAGYQNSDPIFQSSIMANRKVIYLRVEGIDELF
jgi:hypothetical protein